MVFLFFISVAAYRFYRTKSEENAAKKSGKDGVKKLTRRRHERIVRVCSQCGKKKKSLPIAQLFFNALLLPSPPTHTHTSYWCIRIGRAF